MQQPESPSLQRVTVPAALWSGAAAAVAGAMVATIAIAAVPHTRGIGFLFTLRFAIVTPVCVLFAISGAFAYRAFVERVARPRALLAAVFAT
jgi:hypothetical protein